MAHLVATKHHSNDWPPVVGRPGLVGRERELTALERALAGQPAMVMVEGEAGVGKTRLIGEFLASPVGQQRVALVL